MIMTHFRARVQNASHFRFIFSRLLFVLPREDDVDVGLPHTSFICSHAENAELRNGIFSFGESVSLNYERAKLELWSLRNLFR